jgi:anti-sigma regulatory factor (Ser/Thr protein kinase)
MQDVAMLIQELLENSAAAKASVITLTLDPCDALGNLVFRVRDDGCGMDEATVAKVISPFTTSRTTRKVGLGLSFLHQVVTQTQGHLEIDSKPGQGTCVSAHWKADHWDAPPLGNLGEVVMIHLQGHPQLELVVELPDFVLNTADLKAQLDPVPIDDPGVLRYLESSIQTHLTTLREVHR